MNEDIVNLAKIVRVCFGIIKQEFPTLPEIVTRDKNLMYLVQTEHQGSAVLIDFRYRMPVTMDLYKLAIFKSYQYAVETGLANYDVGGSC